MNYSFLLGVLAIILLCSFSNSNSWEETNWFENFDDAQEVAKQNDKMMLMVFAGSDWCNPCILLKQNILDSEEFNVYAQEYLVLVKLDFPAYKKNRLSAEQRKHNDALAEIYNPRGYFPKVLLINANGDVVKHLSYDRNMSPNQFIQQVTVELIHD